MTSEAQKTAIEQYKILLKDQAVQVSEKVIERILSDQNLFVFGEFLSLQSVKSMPADNKAKKTLDLFAFGTYLEYKKESGSFLKLNER